MHHNSIVDTINLLKYNYLLYHIWDNYWSLKIACEFYKILQQLLKWKKKKNLGVLNFQVIDQFTNFFHGLGSVIFWGRMISEDF